MQSPQNPKTRKSFFQTFCRHHGNWIAICFLSIIASACSFPGVYRINVQQGTIITQDMLEQLKPGMTERQVRYVLGTPSAPNTFDNTTETYYYSFQQGNGKIKSQVITLFYDDRRLYSHFTGQPLKEQPAY